mmetsp:Transcript_89269/g.257462  ORF Transcript_89269/g.257462 Transcript_89269/m.257462 type:complete len:205 (-) Transcript_89269:526-1140(-)
MAAHVPPMPAKPIPNMTSSQSCTTSARLYAEGRRSFMPTNTSCRLYFSIMPTVAMRRAFDFPMPKLKKKRCAKRGRIQNCALVRHPVRILASSSVIHFSNIMKKMHLLTTFCTLRRSLKSDNLGALHSSANFSGNCMSLFLYASAPLFKKTSWTKLRMADHSVFAPLGRKMSKFVGKRSGMHALTAPNAALRAWSAFKMLWQSA